MAKFNKPKSNVGSVALVSSIFAILGIVLLVIGYNVKIVSWLKTFGIVFIVLAVPIVIWILYNFINNKIKEM